MPRQWQRRPDHETCLICQLQIRPLDYTIHSFCWCAGEFPPVHSREDAALYSLVERPPTLFARIHTDSCDGRPSLAALTAERSHLTTSDTRNLPALRHQHTPPGIEVLTALQDLHDCLGRNLQNKEHPTHPFAKNGTSRCGMLGLRSDVVCAQPRFAPTSSALASLKRERESEVKRQHRREGP